ncbi:hypothetical protein DL764_008662 [Monosporascus ibericus]|uniref:NAD(P)-binding domain-containing protein n=1 Tax=Monosporascus ibericus TaxID=155417 RepID=A0A4Q4T0C0_9PEZI|nr:hypothetical protein DL764_008662 [Monosporascus ibericus]
MKFIVSPASSQTGRAAVQALLNDTSAPLVVGIYRDLGKVPAGFSSHPNFKAVQGNLTDPSSLDFAGVDGVIVMTPPKYDGSDNIAHAKVIAENVSTLDIGRTCAKELLGTGSGSATNPQIIDLQGPDWYSTRDVQKAFEHVTGKSIEVRLVEKDKLADFFAQFLPSSLVGDYTEMSLSILPGGLLDAEAKTLQNARRGQDTLVDAFKRMWDEANT